MIWVMGDFVAMSVERMYSRNINRNVLESSVFPCEIPFTSLHA